MSVRQRGNNWVIDYYPRGRKGKRVRVTLPDGIGEEEARFYERELREDAKRLDKNYFPRNPLLCQVTEQYLEYCRIHKAARTYQDVKNVFAATLVPLSAAG